MGARSIAGDGTMRSLSSNHMITTNERLGRSTYSVIDIADLTTRRSLDPLDLMEVRRKDWRNYDELPFMKEGIEFT
jgi:hypothetical protein